ncbi:MAG: hypothetical protein ACLP5H_26200 [Desulfomonilaceae bacterium]
MAKKEARQIRANPRVEEYPFEIYSEICDDVLDSIIATEKELKLLQQNCDELGTYFFDYDVPDLLELRNRLEETRNHLSRQNYSLGYGSKLNKILYPPLDS